MSSAVDEVFADDADDASRHWSWTLALNGLLWALGAVVLGMAFQLLDTHDPRTLYNPWTYVVLVPLGIVLISAVLKTLVSRIIERSMQATFLLSVLVHLFVLAWAGNIVLFSRAWPDLFDSLAEERLQLKKQAVQAKQYFHISSKSDSAQLPDYLRYVPTEHSPSPKARIEQAQEMPTVSDPSLLAQPQPELPTSESAHRMERSQASSLPVESADMEASLPRSALSDMAWKNSYLGRLQTIQVPEADPEAAAVRDASPEEMASPLAEIAHHRLGGTHSQGAPELPRELLTNPAASSIQADLNRDASRDVVGETKMRRRIPATPPITPPDGNPSLELQRRSTAGGITGPAARSSQPIDGSPVAAAAEPQIESSMASMIPRRVRSKGDVSASLQLPEVGLSQAPDWDAVSNLSHGISGRSPRQADQSRADGEAAVDDITNLLGSGGDIERATAGLQQPSPGQSKVVDPYSASAQSKDSLLSANQAPPATSSRPEEGSLQLTDSAELPLEAKDATAIRRSRGAQQPQRGGSVSVDDGRQSGIALSSKLPSPLELDVAEGIASLSNANSAEPTLLAMRLRSSSEVVLPGMDPLRLERSPVGESQGPATSAAVAKPAFQQRLDRLSSPSSPEAATGAPTELAIERGLEFLARYQRTNGSWRLQDFDTEVLIRSDTAATGLALLAFQGAGYTHLQSKYARQVHRAIQFLAANQKADGDLYIPQDPASDQNAWLYSHSIAALALCEAYGMTQDQRLKPTAQRAVDFMIQAQDKRRGGWRYRPGAGTDTSVSGWFMMALKSGQLAGLAIPPQTFTDLEAFLKKAQVGPSQPHLFRYNPYAPDTVEQRHGLRPTAVMTSVGLLMRLYLGWNREQAEMQAGADFLLDHVPQHGTTRQTLRDTYYWYYATQVIFHVGGEHWQRWHDALYPLLVEHQVTEGDYRGSWSPTQPVPDLWALYGGRLYVTTMNLLSLEVSYRHLPLYEATSPAGLGK